MIIRKLIECLSDNLSCYVGVQAPTDTSGYVLIDQTGSSRRNHIDSVTVAVQSYGASLLGAIELNEQVRQIMLEELIKDPAIASVRLETDYNFTNTETKQYRWQAVYNITYYHQEV